MVDCNFDANKYSFFRSTPSRPLPFLYAVVVLASNDTRMGMYDYIDPRTLLLTSDDLKKSQAHFRTCLDWFMRHAQRQELLQKYKEAGKKPEGLNTVAEASSMSFLAYSCLCRCVGCGYVASKEKCGGSSTKQPLPLVPLVLVIGL